MKTTAVKSNGGGSRGKRLQPQPHKSTLKKQQKSMATKWIAKKQPKLLKSRGKKKASSRQSCDTSQSSGNEKQCTKKNGLKQYEESKDHMMSLYAAANERLVAFTGPTSLDRPEVKGYDLNQGLNYSKMWQTLSHTGFQATNLGKAIDRVNSMIKWRLSHEPVTADTPAHLRDPVVRENVRCTIFLGYTSNMSSCGMREYIRYLCQHKMVDAIVTTCGGIEEDFMKCMTPFYIGDFYLKGKTLRSEGINRTGNLLVPMKNYHTLQDWMGPIMKQMHKEQTENGTVWSPSKIINRLGKKINNEESVYYWCWKNDIPVFSPAITDGEIGDIIFDHTYTNGPGFVVDIAQDVVKINEIALRAHKSGILIVGGGVIKHHICNAQIRRGGADLSVYVNTAVDYDGSDSGATPDEAVSWGKISDKAEPVKIWAEATLVLPTLIGETFARNFDLAKRT